VPTAKAVYDALNIAYPVESWYSGDGTTTTWTVPTVATAHLIEVFINGVKQQ